MKTNRGHGRDQKYKIGDVVIRIRSRNRERRAYIKVAEPSVWTLLARFVWEQVNGPIPVGYGIHHKDENMLNDDIGNLQLVSKAEHLAIHVSEYRERIISNLVEHRKRRRWSTKSEIKRVGRHPKNCKCSIHKGNINGDGAGL